MGVNSLPWFYTESLPGIHEMAVLAGEEWHHCLNVLRINEGGSMILFNGKGICFEAVLRHSAKSQGQLELMVDRTNEFLSPSACHINIAFAPTKNVDRLEMAVEKVVEIGVESITMLECQFGERTRVRMDRIHKIVLSAAKQSRKLWLPEIRDSSSPIEVCLQSKIRNPNSKILCCHLDVDSRPLHNTYQGEQDVVVLIGPEGGFSPDEIEKLKSAGALMTTLGPHRLRVETAVITACGNVHLLYAMKNKS